MCSQLMVPKFLFAHVTQLLRFVNCSIECQLFHHCGFKCLMCALFVWLHLHTDPFMRKYDLARAIGSQQGQLHCPPCWNVVIVCCSPYTVLLVGMW